MRKRNGWCIWSPWSGYLSSTFACTRTECIKLFERDSNSPWRRYREQGFECRPVLFVDARAAMRPNPAALSAELGNIHQIAGAALSKENSND